MSSLKNIVSKITVICLEGCHGSGKTELCKYLSKKGFNVMDEAFLDMPRYTQIPPQSLTMETIWVSNWFNRILKINQNIQNNNSSNNNNNNSKLNNHIFIADRSPFSAILYARGKGHHLNPLISSQIEELRSYAQIDIKTVYLQVDDDKLWQRIEDRLKREPERKNYGEDKRAWMEDSVRFYNQSKWDLTINNDDLQTFQQRTESIFKSFNLELPNNISLTNNNNNNNNNLDNNNSSKETKVQYWQ
ncbi:hypothetical protein PPL_03552 [Heterostelium album PN500]|uniref:P-loop containing nucleoside triphosphate hydrolase protein n=1 Tax=Heterostelium pallidum (strain ATCC 26659 / Pp 5 / PN500) TaxID=670386 RepID=D3B541_HETP5|nr:hypothetical protein PPL_03552 [Heterostelium album PN500]EFA83406.1 hypothetical protein PPL_03552 [Heterostelium album PN500]|eukprot:XP_020435523.1 hypothetical protein PPL_03552 [Heterostelium album PN500]